MRIFSKSISVAVVFALSAVPGTAQETKLAVPAPATVSHPWASFAQGAWVEVHVSHELVRDGSKPSKWDADYRLSVGKISAKSVIVHRAASKTVPAEEATVTIPAVTALPGVRAIGQWPQDLFSIGPKREPGAKSKDKQHHPKSQKTVVEAGKEVTFKGRVFDAKLITRTWTETVAGTDRAYVMKAWVVDGFDLPVKWTMSLDGDERAKTEILKVAEAVNVTKRDIPCFMTLTTVTMPSGKMIKRRWSNSGVPGFMVKMESRLKSDGIIFEINEHVSAFQTVPEPAKKDAEAEDSEGRPALGFMPDYEADAEGALAQRITEGGPAGAAGMREGDLIVEIDDEPIMSFKDYMEVLGSLVVGQKVLVTVERDGKAKLLTVKVGQRGH